MNEMERMALEQEYAIRKTGRHHMSQYETGAKSTQPSVAQIMQQRLSDQTQRIENYCMHLTHLIDQITGSAAQPPTPQQLGNTVTPIQTTLATSITDLEQAIERLGNVIRRLEG